MAVVYFLVMWTALIAFCSLAVDFGRVQMVKEQLQCAADAAARAGLVNLATSVSAAQTAAVNVAAANTVDGAAVTIATTDVAFGYWNPVAQTFTVATTAATQLAANAVQVTASRTAAKTNAVPLLFASIVGRGTCDVHSTAIACKAANVPLVNPDFELPALGTGNYTYDCSMPGWTLTGSACLATYGSAWGMSQPNGNQAVAVQGNPSLSLAKVTQTFPVVAGTYNVSLYAAQRTSFYSGSTALQPVTVSVDGAVIATISPTSGTFAQYSTPNVVLATGTHTLAIAATDNATDHTTFIDTVTVNVQAYSIYLAH